MKTEAVKINVSTGRLRVWKGLLEILFYDAASLTESV